MKKILLLFILWFLLLNTLNILSSHLITDYTSYELPKNITISPRHIFVPWLNFDGRNYLEIASQGYVHKYRVDLRVFFPLYPLLIRILSFNFRFYPVLVGLIISLTSFIGCLFVFDRLLHDENVSKKTRAKVFILLLLFPTSYYFLAFYTESLFLLLTLLTFYYLNKKNFLLASIFTAFATATRIIGLALIPAILFEAYHSYKRNKKIPFLIIITPLGYFIYSAYLQMISGNAFSVILKQKDWNRQISIFSPWTALKEGFVKIVYGSALSRSNTIIHFIEQLEFFMAILILIFLIISINKIKFSYWLYVFFSLVPIFFSGMLSSIPRYIIVMFPIYIFLARKIPEKYFYFICTVFFILLIILTSLFLRGYWVA